MALVNSEKLIDNLLNGGGDGKNNRSNFLRLPPEEGSIKYIRILPICDKTVKLVYQHWGIDKFPFMCLHTFDKKCPVCDALYKTPKLEKEAFKKKMSYTKKESVWLYVVEMEKTSAGFKVASETPVIFSTTQSFIDFICKALPEQGVNAVDPVGGFIISLRRNKKGKIDKLPVVSFDISNMLTIFEQNLVDFNDLLEEPDEETVKQVLSALEEKIIKLIGNSTEEPVSSDKITKTDLLAEKREQIQKHTGILIDDEKYLACFGGYCENESKCMTCPYAIGCEEYSAFPSEVNEVDDVPF